MTVRADRGAEPEASTAPWNGRQITWRIDGEDHTASYNPAEELLMRTARERGCTTADLESVHLVKAILGGVIVDAEDSVERTRPETSRDAREAA